LSIERERREDIEREQEARAERLEQSREYLEQSRENAELVAEARINPGDYDCPECFFRTLKYRARRCPTCQASIGTEYWNQVDERKRIEAERAAERARADAKAAKEKWEREAPAREQAAREAAQNLARRAAEGRSNTFLGFFYVFMPVLCFLTVFLILKGTLPSFGMFVLFCIPALNWIMILLDLLFGDNANEKALIIKSLICWGLAGLVIGYVIRKFPTSS